MKKAVFFLICVTLVLSLCSCSSTPAIETFDINEIFTQYFDAGIPYTFTVGEQEYALSVADGGVCTLLTTEVNVSELEDVGATVTSSVHYQYVGTYELSDDASTLNARFDHLYISADYKSDGMSMDQLWAMELQQLLAAYGEGEEYQLYVAVRDGKTVEAPSSEFDYATVECTFSSDERVFSAFRMENYIDDTLETALELTDEGWLNYRYHNGEGSSSVTVRNGNNIVIRSITTVTNPDGSYSIHEYEENGVKKDFYYDTDGRLTEELHHNENYQLVYEKIHRYEEDGTCEVVTFQNGRQCSYYYYDADGTLLQWWERNENGDVLNGLYETRRDEWQSEYHEYANGLLIQSITYYFDGTPPSYIKYEYDSNGQPTKIVSYDPDGSIRSYVEYNSNGQKQMSYHYNWDGTMCKSVYSYNTDGTWSEQWYSYDSNGILTRQIHYFYNTDGTLDYRDEHYFDSDGNLIE